jgi:hypothetical protein
MMSLLVTNKRRLMPRTLSEADGIQARALWDEYQRSHDVSAFIGRVAGIDPESGRVWFGESAQDIWQKMQQEGINAPFYCVRVGQDFYVRKGGHR